MSKKFSDLRVIDGGLWVKTGSPKCQLVFSKWQPRRPEYWCDVEVILRTFLVNGCPAMDFVNVGASRSFSSTDFCVWYVFPHGLHSSFLDIEVPVGSSIWVRENFDGCSIVICDHTFPLNFIPIKIMSFDIIISMDWLSANLDDILYAEKWIRILLAEGGYVITHDQKSMGSIPIISMMKACMYLKRGYEVFLAQAIGRSRKTVELADVEVVMEYSNVFCDDFPDQSHSWHGELLGKWFGVSNSCICIEVMATYGTKCTLYTDHKCFLYIQNQNKLNMRQRHWVKLLVDYDCEIS